MSVMPMFTHDAAEIFLIAVSHRIIESLRLEKTSKTSKIAKSKCQPITTIPAKPCPEVPHLHVFFNTSRAGD